jgi:hypothetical protein
MDETRRILETAELFWLTTVRADSRPHVTLAEAWAGKWDGRWRLAVREGGFRHGAEDFSSEVFSVAPTKIYAHAKGDRFGQATHRF